MKPSAKIKKRAEEIYELRGTNDSKIQEVLSRLAALSEATLEHLDAQEEEKGKCKHPGCEGCGSSEWTERKLPPNPLSNY